MSNPEISSTKVFRMLENKIPLATAARRIGVSYHSLIMKIRKKKVEDIKIDGKRYLTEEEVRRLEAIEHLKRQRQLLEA